MDATAGLLFALKSSDLEGGSGISTYCGAGVKAFATALKPLLAVSTNALPAPLAVSTIALPAPFTESTMELPAPLAASKIPPTTPGRPALSLSPKRELSPRAALALIAAAISAVVAGCEPAIVGPPASIALICLATSIACCCSCFFFSSSANRGSTKPSVA